MRNLPARTSLPKVTQAQLKAKTVVIKRSADRLAAAKAAYRAARTPTWFEPVVLELGELAGTGQRCMWCSGSEAGHVEHYRPLAVFPDQALSWKNLLWSCSICNGHKGDRFPPVTSPGGQLINPLEENVWEFFFIDEFGNLTPRWDSERDDYNERADSTFRMLNLDRQALQETRQSRQIDLIQKVKDAMAMLEAGRFSKPQLRQRIDEWLQQPFQPDVADFYLRGPGRDDEPFQSLFELLN